MERDKAYLLDILEAAKIILEYVKNKSKDQFCKDLQCQDAVIHRLSIIGEAAKRVSREKQNSLSNLPWKEMIGMRNFLIHSYDHVDLDIVWDTIQSNLPSLVENLKKILS